MARAYWDKLALEAGQSKALGSRKNFIAIYADARVRDLLLDSVNRYGNEAQGYLLDIGCGPGKWTSLLAESFHQLRVIGIDLSMQMLKLAKRRIRSGIANFAEMNAIKLGFRSDLFNIVTSVTVLQHISDYDCAWRRTIWELVRVTKPKGHIIIYEIATPIWHFKVRRLDEYVSEFRMAGAKLMYWKGVDPSYPLTLLGLLQYYRSFELEKVYSSEKHPQLLSRMSMILAKLARIVDSRIGTTVLGILAPHKFMVFEKEHSYS
jgi:ubiquinone/menaquinone biosynthesis C-methylase UbiE